MEQIRLTSEYKTYKSFLHKTAFFSSAGKPLSRIVLYKSGANRLYRMPEHLTNTELPKRKKDDITTFSYNTRKRYFDYCNSLPLNKDYYVYILTFTTQTFIDSLMTKEIFQHASKLLFKKLNTPGV